MTTTAELIDTNTSFGARAAKRLEAEKVAWLTTVGRTGTPQPNPVWFVWDGTSILVFTQPGTPKLRNIQANSRVSVNLNSTRSGGDVVVLAGTATVEANADQVRAKYVDKYADDIRELNMTEEQFFDDYSVAVRITPDRLRGF